MGVFLFLPFFQFWELKGDRGISSGCGVLPALNLAARLLSFNFFNFLISPLQKKSRDFSKKA
jgi:hypothetical protein